MTVMEALNEGAAEAALAALAALPPTERRKLAPQILARYRAWHKFGSITNPTNPTSFYAEGTDDQRTASRVCVTAVATASELVNDRNFPILTKTDIVMSVVKLLCPPWLNANGLEALANGEKIDWLTVESLIEAGYCKRPSSDKLVESLVERAGIRKEEPLATQLRRHAGLFTDGVLYRLFEVEGGQQSSPAAADKYRPEGRRWATALEDLSKAGELDRNRLIDGCLDALSRDFAAFRAGWYARLHERLKPSHEECAARAKAYLRLTGSAIPATVAFAVKTIERLAKVGRLTPDQLTAALPPAIHARQKGTVTRTAKLLTAAARRAPVHAVAVIEVLCDGLMHTDPNVQKMILDHIDMLLPLAQSNRQSLLDRLGGYHDLVAPSLRVRLPRPQKTDAMAAAESQAPPVPADPYHEHYALTLAKTLEDAIDTVAFALEHEEDPIAQEQALDAIARHPPPTDNWPSLAGPLRKRAEELWKRNRSQEIHDHAMRYTLAYLALAWTRGEKPERQQVPVQKKMDFDFYFNRVDRLADRILAGTALPLLSTPTHRGGHLTIARYQEVLDLWTGSGEPLDPYDAVLALMRLPPAVREEARNALKVIPAEGVDQAAAAAALSYRYKISSRHSNGFTYHYLSVDPLGAPPGPRSPLELRRALIHGDIHRNMHPNEAVARWRATVSPHDLQTHFVMGMRQLAICLRHQIDSPLVSGLYLEPARDPWVVLGTEGHWLLMLLLAARGARAVEVGLDVAIDGVVQNRVDAGELGGALAQLMASGVLQGKRAASSFSQIAAVSPEHAAWVRHVIARSLRGDPDDAPRDIAARLSLLFELLVEATETLADPEARRWLETARRGGQAAKLRMAILAL